MGRITIFTSGDLNSKRALSALEERKLPYVEISTVHNPDKRNDLKALSQSYGVPQVFFNTRCVGGVDDLLKELKLWDAGSKYLTPLEKYKAELATLPEPSNPKLAVPALSRAAAVLGRPREPAPTVMLPDGTLTSYFDITEKLKNTLTFTSIQHSSTVYKRAFTGKSAIDKFRRSLGLTHKEALAFGSKLLESKVIRTVESATTRALSITSSNQFKDSEGAIYRLQCHSTPDVLNSYRRWPEPSSKTPMELIEELDNLLSSVELRATTRRGKVDYGKVLKDREYHIFEESVCELQKSDISGMKEKEMLAFGLNLYKLMLRFGIVKVGMPENEAGRLFFLRNVKFNVGDNEYTFQDWFDGILRANSKITSSGTIPFNMVDRRRKLALSKQDNRVHFAVNLDATLGSRTGLPFRRYTAENIDEELDIAARVLCADEAYISISKRSNDVKLAKFFQWYRSDFGRKEHDVLSTIRGYLDGPKRSDVKFAIAGQPKTHYMEVNWARNASNFSKFNPDSLVSESRSLGMILKRFTAPTMTRNEQARMATLRSLNILDTLPEERFDRITRMCQDEFDVHLVFISLIDENRQWFKSTQWACPLPQASETGRDISFCGHAIHAPDDEVFYIPDATQDDRFADNPLVTGALSIRFYAGAPLTVPSADGCGLVNIGTLCIISQVPRPNFSVADKEKLRYYATQVKQEILRKDELSPY